MFKDMRVVGLGERASLQPTMGSILNPSTALKNISAMRHPPIRDILSGFEGVVMPGEMLREFRLCFILHPCSDLHQLFWGVPVRAAAHF
jgi:hypothetical protein